MTVKENKERVKSVTGGLQVELGNDGFQKRKAAQNGLFFWDKSSQELIREYLGEFLPKVEEKKEKGKSVAVFSRIESGREVLQKSEELGLRKIPRKLHNRLRTQCENLQSIQKNPNATTDSKMLAKEFKFPDPACSPELYRYRFTMWKGARLNILWGMEGKGVRLVSSQDMLAKISPEPVWLTVLKRVLAFWWLLIPLLILWVWSEFPSLKIRVEDDRVKAGDMLEVVLEASNPRASYFWFHPEDVATIVKLEPPLDDRMAPLEWEVLGEGRSGAQKVVLVYSQEGEFMLRLRGKASFFGVLIPLKPVEQKIEVVSASAHTLFHWTLKTPERTLPAKVKFVAKDRAGVLKIQGVEEQKSLDPSHPLENDFAKPGQYLCTFDAPADTSKSLPPRSDTQKITILGKDPLVANLRVSKAKVEVDECFEIDATSSFSEDPKDVLVKEYSEDNGTTWHSVASDPMTIRLADAGKRKIHLRVTNQASVVATDWAEVEVTNYLLNPEPTVALRPSDQIVQGGKVFIDLNRNIKNPQAQCKKSEISLDGGKSWENVPTGQTIVEKQFSAEGRYGILLRVVDSKGKEGTSPKIVLTVSKKVKIAPKIVVNSPDSVLVGEPWNFDFAGSAVQDPDATGSLSLEYARDNGQYQKAQGVGATSLCFDAPGTKTVRFRVTDSLGNVAEETKTIAVLTRTEHPPVMKVVWSKPADEGFLGGEKVDIDTTASQSDPYSKIDKREISFDGGTTWQKLSSGLAQVTIPDASLGVVEVCVRISDTKGRISEEKRKIEVGFVMQGDQSFESGSHELSPLGKRRLDSLARDMLKSNPPFSILIVGHTDNVLPKPNGPYRGDNVLLSELRAKAAQDWLIQKGVQANRIGIVGKGANEPIADNKDSAGREKNRRIEIIAIKK